MSIRLEQHRRLNREPVTTDDLEAYFHRACVPASRWRVGAEFEQLALWRASGRQVSYGGPEGVGAILRRIADRYGWTPYFEDGHLVALEREGAVLTFEPGAQVELATPPAETLEEVARCLARHLEELRSVVDPRNIAWVSLGVTPFSADHDIPLVPKARYRVMADYLPRRSTHAHQMMRCTASTQASYDYPDEQGAGKRFHVALSLSPFASAMFANSPVYRGRLTGVLSYRGRIWHEMDPDRSGLLCDLVQDEHFSFRRWVDFMLDLPMMFYCLNDRFLPARGRPFRDFMAHGLDGYYPTLEDWEMHLTTIFTEVRLKSYLEVRGADATSPELAMGFVALWKGILHDETALEEALILAREVPSACREGLFLEHIARGLQGTYRGRPVHAWCSDLLDIAARGLERQSRPGRPSEVRFLDPVREVVADRRSPAARLAGAWPRLAGDPVRTLELVCS